MFFPILPGKSKFAALLSECSIRLLLQLLSYSKEIIIDNLLFESALHLLFESLEVTRLEDLELRVEADDEVLVDLHLDLLAYLCEHFLLVLVRLGIVVVD